MFLCFNEFESKHLACLTRSGIDEAYTDEVSTISDETHHKMRAHLIEEIKLFHQISLDFPEITFAIEFVSDSQDSLLKDPHATELLQIYFRSNKVESFVKDFVRSNLYYGNHNYYPKKNFEEPCRVLARKLMKFGHNLTEIKENCQCSSE